MCFRRRNPHGLFSLDFLASWSPGRIDQWMVPMVVWRVEVEKGWALPSYLFPCFGPLRQLPLYCPANLISSPYPAAYCCKTLGTSMSWCFPSPNPKPGLELLKIVPSKRSVRSKHLRGGGFLLGQTDILTLVNIIRTEIYFLCNRSWVFSDCTSGLLTMYKVILERFASFLKQEFELLTVKPMFGNTALTVVFDFSSIFLKVTLHCILLKKSYTTA